ncbi:MAG: ADP-ribosylglycohydrolase family protein [Chloroflexi bacterium]|nr:MAG: ADP-ribosylglycohydrolase family protein [Chloroflexota bacterium]MBL1194715.1 ADP-ribosylglycohydrolase family protein [Chloroflexota bacterium]NOH12008.1 ADP-ribosylglycohydrolase family protein [Chloroflexota bacterium]
MPLPTDYLERVYAGVLGKLIGVYLGRPVEGWTYERINERFGEIDSYIHEQLDQQLIVTDDDIGGTFTFIRALEDHASGLDITPADIGETWLNYLIENRTILWWGGLGNSTEHTAYLRLKQGISAPASGSIALNGPVVAQQIGSQIFIDSWAMVVPSDPEMAADLAGRAASVSHDGEAIYAAQLLAAMQSMAFVEDDTNTLLDTALGLILSDALMPRLVEDVRNWHAKEEDWRIARQHIADNYGYDKYGGNCHIVPNHALILLGLLYGEDDLKKSLMITNTSGWDTDCNGGNLGCLLGIKNGLTGIDAHPDLRQPIADRLYISSADGGRAISDAVQESYILANLVGKLAGEAPLNPKDAARFHFELPGALQGFQVSSKGQAPAELENVVGHSLSGKRSLAIRFQALSSEDAIQAHTPTFIPPEASKESIYPLLASPTLYSGQQVKARMVADAKNQAAIQVKLFIQYYGADDYLEIIYADESTLQPDTDIELDWSIEAPEGVPIVSIGLEISSDGSTAGTLYLDYLGWHGPPDIVLRKPDQAGQMWQRAWVNGVDQLDNYWEDTYRLVQNEGRGLLMQGTRQWKDYKGSANIRVDLAKSAGLGVMVQGMRRYYALLLTEQGQARLVKRLHSEELILAEKDLKIDFGNHYEFSLQCVDGQLDAWVDGEHVFSVEDKDDPFDGGAVALLCEAGTMASDAVIVKPA